jgi:hypothetical protein
MQRERTRSIGARAEWKKLAKKLAGATAAVLVGAGLTGAPSEGQAGFNINPMCAPSEVHICAFSPRRRKTRKAISATLNRAALGLSALARYAAATLPMIAF